MQIRVVPSMLIGVATLLIAHLVTSFVPSLRTWGIDYWSDVPIAVRFGFIAVAAVALIPRVSAACDGLAARLGEWRVVRHASLFILFGLLILFRSRGLSYGDGYSVQALVSSEHFPTLTGNLTLMPGDIFIHWIAYHFVFLPFNGSAAMTYAVLSALAGVLSFLACLQIARKLFPESDGARWFVTIAALTSGMTVMWFGHVEAYSLTNCAMLWSLALAIESRASLWVHIGAWFFWFVAVTMHFLALAMLPALLWSLGQRKRLVPPHWVSGRRGVILLIGGFIGSGIVSLLLAHFTTGVVVPLASSESSAYTAFSVAHLLDILNLLVFCAPMGLLGLMIAVHMKPLAESGIRSTSGPEGHLEVVAVAAASLWFFAFWVDPLIGGFRDWDLLGAFGIPFTLWGAAVLIRAQPQYSRFSLNWVVVGALAFAHVGGFVWSIQDEQQVMLRIDRMVDKDIHYSERFHNGERLVSWAHTLSRVLGRDDLAQVRNRARVTYEPNDPTAWCNLAMNYWNLKLPLEARDAQTRSLLLEPGVPDKWLDLGRICMELDDLECIRDAYEHYLSFADTSCFHRTTLASVYIDLQRVADATPLLEKSRKECPKRYEPHYLLGLIAERGGDTTAAISHYEEAVNVGGELPDLRRRLTTLYQATGIRAK